MSKSIGIALGLILILVIGVRAEAADADLVRLKDVDPALRTELKYKTADNFMGEVLYPESFECYLRPEVARRLVKVQQQLQAQGLGLKIYDGYRPLSVQRKMFARFPQPGYVADPKKGSNHNRGAAVDLTLVDSEGRELAMPTPYDEFSERAHRDYEGGDTVERQNRRILQTAMTQAGFIPLSSEWWHFDDPDAKSFDVLDIYPEKPIHEISQFPNPEPEPVL